MTLSIWWFVGLSQLTLIAVLGCIFSISALKNTKKQRDNLKDSVAQTTKDYYEFIESIESKLSSQSYSSNSDSTPQATTSDFSKHVENMMENIPDDVKQMSPDSTPNQLDKSQLAHFLELKVLQLTLSKDSELASKREKWDQFVFNLSSTIDENLNKYSELHQLVETVRLDWQEKKSSLQNTFETIVKSTQKTDHSNEIHQNLNILYNDFIDILNRIPGVAEENQDALLKMESVDAGTDETEEHETSEKPALSTETLLKEDLSLTIPDESPPLNHDNSDSSVNIEESETTTEMLEQAMPISEHNLDDDDLLQTNTAIEEFEEESSTPIHSNSEDKTNSDDTPLNAEKMIEESLGMDEGDDIFGDLMSAMDEAIANRQDQEQPSENDQKQN